MRVAFDARVLANPALAERGIGRYAASLLRALTESSRDVVALEDVRRPPAPARIAEFLEHGLLARNVRRAGADVLHSPTIDYATTRPGGAYVVTVHDLVPLKHPQRYLRTGLKHRVRYAAVRGATRVIAPTAAVARDCEQFLGVKAGRIDVVAEAAAPVFRPVADARAALSRIELPDRFLLWVGGLDPPDPRKGLEALTEAAARRDGAPLVLAGRTDAEAAALAAPGRVILTGRVSDEELAALYTAADALVLSSEEEGFGLPVIEALACGTPVAAYAIDALRELYGSRPGVVLVEPGDLDALLDAAGSMAGATVAPVDRRWTDVAAETWAVYEAALG
jgi:glycosyltransferase involved in cell wall biosynthesis